MINIYHVDFWYWQFHDLFKDKQTYQFIRTTTADYDDMLMRPHLICIAENHQI